MRCTNTNWKRQGLRFILLSLVMLPSRPAWGQVDLNGEWSPRVYNDNRDIGDYTGIPLNEAGRLRAESWTPDQADLPENICKPHTFDLGFHVAPSQIYISTVSDSASLRIIAYHIYAPFVEQTIWMDGRPHPPDYAAHKWQGFSTGKWEDGTLVYTTDHLKEGYLTRDGVPSSAKASVTTLINRYGNYLTIRTIVKDPVYLTEPYVRESNFVYAPNQVMIRMACEMVGEGTVLPAGAVPSYLPGENDVLSDFAVEYGIPPEAALGGAETMYPEYIKKMKTLKKAPRTTTTHFRRFG